MKKVGIYRITSPSGNMYIGSSVDVQRRKGQHIGAMRSNRHENERLQSSANKYGVEKMLFEHICSLLPGSQLHELEQLVIDQYKPKLNRTQNALCATSDPVVARKISIAAKASKKHGEARAKNVLKAWAALRRPVIRLDDGKLYESAYAAASDAGSSKYIDNIFTALKNKQKYCGYYFAYADSGITMEMVKEQVDRKELERKKNAAAAMIRGRCRNIIRVNDGMIYHSLSEAARQNGTCHTSIAKSIKQNRPVNGVSWAYGET